MTGLWRPSTPRSSPRSTDTGKISDELKEQVLSAVRQFKSR